MPDGLASAVSPVFTGRGDDVSTLVAPAEVLRHMQEAGRALSAAHAAAAEQEGDRDGLIGTVRDAIFGLNTTLDALTQMIEEGRFDG